MARRRGARRVWWRAASRIGRSGRDPDLEQLLPAGAGTFSDGVRAIAPPDVLATFVGAFGIDPRRYMRDGEIVKELLV